MERVFAVLNARAGALIGLDPRDVERRARSALAARGRDVEVVLARGRALTRAIDHGIAGDYDTVVVGGGDGSVSYAAARLAGSDKALGVLPFGTMNLFGRDLGMPEDADTAFAALAQATPRRVDLGVINGRPFHTLSGVGFFSQIARAREETRDLPHKLLRVGAAALRAFRRTRRLTLAIAIDGREREIDCYAVLVTVNCFREADWRRSQLDAGTLEVHIAEDRGALSKLKAGADLVTGRWREGGEIQSFTASAVSITSPRRRHASVSTDGELHRERLPLAYSLRRRALLVLVPPPVEALSAEALR